MEFSIYKGERWELVGIVTCHVTPYRMILAAGRLAHSMFTLLADHHVGNFSYGVNAQVAAFLWGAGFWSQIEYRKTSISGIIFSGEKCLSGTNFHAI
jgi:hypothetical protein